MTQVLPGGFTAAGIACGIKPSGVSDLALVAAQPVLPINAAAVFTQSLAAAAPVQLSHEHLAKSGGRIGAVIMNSGCANAATGDAGYAAAEETAALTASVLGLEPQQVLVCSTGVIGCELPMEPIRAGIPGVVAALAATDESLAGATRAMMTTDTREKLSSVSLSSSAHVGGIAKGAAMLAPNMATMLAVLMTDAEASPDELDSVLRAAVDRSFHELSVDGCTSTNDTVIALASGAAGPSASGAELTEAFTKVCRDLAHQMAADAEGGTKVVRVVVRGATDDASARRGARKIVDANLVKCSWYGADPNWGRVVSELGTAGIGFDLRLVSVAYGDHVVCRGGAGVAHDEEAVAAYLKGPEIEILCELGLGAGWAEMLSSDLTHGYIDENMGLS